MGSLPSATQSWMVYRNVPVDKAFYLQLQVVEHRGAKLIADIALISDDASYYAEINSAEVTASESLNDLFIK